ncbi:hypothetical protein C8R46DRAFT_1137807 [Mycena filopes]|nr:hypothetical protein C8R46DRAFT_1137807 [Mycena filopes]
MNRVRQSYRSSRRAGQRARMAGKGSSTESTSASTSSAGRMGKASQARCAGSMVRRVRRPRSVRRMARTHSVFSWTSTSDLRRGRSGNIGCVAGSKPIVEELEREMCVKFGAAKSTLWRRAEDQADAIQWTRLRDSRGGSWTVAGLYKRSVRGNSGCTRTSTSVQRRRTSVLRSKRVVERRILRTRRATFGCSRPPEREGHCLLPLSQTFSYKSSSPRSLHRLQTHLSEHAAFKKR